MRIQLMLLEHGLSALRLIMTAGISFSLSLGAVLLWIQAAGNGHG
jgi:hypothetical protein